MNINISLCEKPNGEIVYVQVLKYILQKVALADLKKKGSDDNDGFEKRARSSSARNGEVNKEGDKKKNKEKKEDEVVLFV